MMRGISPDMPSYFLSSSIPTHNLNPKRGDNGKKVYPDRKQGVSRDYPPEMLTKNELKSSYSVENPYMEEKWLANSVSNFNKSLK